MTLDELLVRRRRLQVARYSGTMTISIDHETIVYKSDAQLAAAMASVEAEIRKLTRGSRPRTIRPTTTKGLN